MLYIVKNYDNDYGIVMDGVININNYQKSQEIYSNDSHVSAAVQVYALSQELIDCLNNPSVNQMLFPIKPIETKYYNTSVNSALASTLEITSAAEIELIRVALGLSPEILIEPFVIGDYNGAI